MGVPPEVASLRRRLGRQLAEHRKSTGYSQAAFAPLTGYARSTVANVEVGRQQAPREFWQRCDQALGSGATFTVAYDALQAIILRHREAAARAAQAERQALVQQRQAQGGRRNDDQRKADIERRSLLADDLAAWRLPALNLDHLRHIAAAMDDAQRNLDGSVIEFFRDQLAACASEDRTRGPAASLPTVLGILGAVQYTLPQVKGQVRRELLAIGTRSAEFAGWLYRDSGAPALADYWRDRAMEWAQVAGDTTMQGYILLKKSQVAWDQRDAVRMLTLAQAVQDGTWHLPSTVQAEAAQQAARGHAMLGDSLRHVERQLDTAHRLLADDTDVDDQQPGIHYDAALLAMQTAICFQEAGQPQRAVTIYGDQLTKSNFSRRDYGYFMSLHGNALAAAHEPDEAATVGLVAHSIASDTNSVRTVQELSRLVRQLDAWATRPAVRELRDAILAY